ATLTGNGTKITRAKIHADLTDTVVTLDYLNWLKPEDMPVMLDLDMAFKSDSYDFSNCTLTGDKIDAAGEFVMNKSWDWMSLSFPKVQLGPRNNLSMRGRRDDQDTLSLDINGTSADVGGLLHNFVSGGGDRV